MPGWHAITEPYRLDGSIEVVGIILEQHPARASLFMQWKQMNWPLLVDATNELQVPAVPYTIFLDEHGVIRAVNPRPPKTALEDFLNTSFDAPAVIPAVGEIETPHKAGVLRLETATSTDHLREATTLFQQAIDADPDEGHHWFALGVAKRRLFESTGDPRDFAAAVEAWEAALERDPNQYIWRRRIQQFGPRLDKPYSFYDWVETARAEITTRGETPRTLRVEPSGAEYARPARRFTGADDATNPDPDGRIERDTRYINATPIVVPHTSKGRTSTRIHIHFAPNAAADGHWNNEAEPLRVWIDPPAGWQVSHRLVTVANAAAATSDEVRTVEFELTRDGDPGGDADGGDLPTIPVYALYNVCEGANGTCLYRRLDLDVALR